MTQSDRMEILRRAVATHGQTGVARRIGRQNSAISQILSGKYGGSPDTILELVEAEFGNSTVDCPVMGDETPLAECLDARARADRPLFVTGGQSSKLYRACQTCPHKGGTR